MLGAQPFPFGAKPYCDTEKTVTMRRAALALDIPPTTHAAVDQTRNQWFLPLLAVTFAGR
jgi:hypothetical protein